MHTKENKMIFFFSSGLLTSTAPRADVITGKATRVKVTGLNSRSQVKTMAQIPVEWTGACRRVREFLVASFLGMVDRTAKNVVMVVVLWIATQRRQISDMVVSALLEGIWSFDQHGEACSPFDLVAFVALERSTPDLLNRGSGYVIWWTETPVLFRGGSGGAGGRWGLCWSYWKARGGACGGGIWLDNRGFAYLWVVYWSVQTDFQKNEICGERPFGWDFFFFFEMRKRKDRVAR